MNIEYITYYWPGANVSTAGATTARDLLQLVGTAPKSIPVHSSDFALAKSETLLIGLVVIGRSGHD